MDTGEVGRNIVRDLMGDEYMVRREKVKNGFNDVMQEYADEVCFGRVWARDGIDRKLRSILTIAMMVALNRPTQVRLHVEGALNNGTTPDEIKEILLHAAVYCGLPAAGEAFKVAEEVLKARGLLE